MPETKPTLYQALTAAGIETGSHESDLHFPVTPESTQLLANYPLLQKNATTFRDKTNGQSCYDVPFAYDPWWEQRSRRA